MIKMTKIPDEGSTVYSEQMKAKRNQNKKQMAGFVPICQNADPFLSILVSYGAPCSLVILNNN